MRRFLLALAVLLLHIEPALAYIGPGAGVGLLGSLWAWLLGIVLVLLAILIWPIRWLLRRMRASRRGSAAADK